MSTTLVWAALAVVILGVVVWLLFRTRRRVINYFESDVARRRPLGANGIIIGAEPVHLRGSPHHAVLLIHGFGDTPQSVRPLADALHNAGWTVHVLLLPGHGRTLKEYAASGGAEWVQAVRKAYDDLRAQHGTVVVCGISMGAALSVVLAAEHPEIPALALLAPYLVMPRHMHMKMKLAQLVSFVLPYRASSGGEHSIHDAAARARTLGVGVVTARLLSELRQVTLQAQRALPAVKARTLYLQSREDNRIDAADAVTQFPRLGSATTELRWLTGCGHIITADFCKDEVGRQVIAWFASELRDARHSPDMQKALR